MTNTREEVKERFLETFNRVRLASSVHLQYVALESVLLEALSEERSRVLEEAIQVVETYKANAQTHVSQDCDGLFYTCGCVECAKSVTAGEVLGALNSLKGN